MAGQKKVKIPAQVLERARLLSKAPRPPASPKLDAAPPAGSANGAKQKIVLSLRKLHPMD